MKEQDYILFEDYLEGTLSPTEKNEFERRLADDEKFEQSFLTYKELSGFLDNKFEDKNPDNQFKENLKNISNTYFNKTENKSSKRGTIRFKPWQYAIAASIVVIFGLLVIMNDSTPAYADYADFNNISLTERGENDELLSKAEKTFNEGNYEEAIQYFDQILIEDANYKEIQLYKSIALIETNQYDDADELLSVLSTGTSVFKYDAMWYLALSKLKQKKYEQCRIILERIPEDAEVYKKAQKLLSKL